LLYEQTHDGRNKKQVLPLLLPDTSAAAISLLAARPIMTISNASSNDENIN
jgi:hypothetical protein